MVQHTNINVINHTHRIKDKIHMTILIDAEKAFDKIKYSFMIKAFNKLAIERNFINLLKPKKIHR